MVLKFLKSLFAFKTKKRINDIIERLQDHMLHSGEFRTWADRGLSRIATAYKNKFKILNLKDKFEYLVANNKARETAEELIRFQTGHLTSFKNMLDRSLAEIGPISGKLSEYDRTIKKFLDDIIKAQAIITQYGAKLGSQTTALSSKDLGMADKKLWDENELIENLTIIIKTLLKDGSQLETIIKGLIQAKGLIDKHFSNLKTKIEKMNGTYVLGNWGLSYTNNGASLKPRDIKEKLGKINFESWKRGFEIFLEALKRDVDELDTSCNTFQSDLFDDWGSHQIIKMDYEAELAYVHTNRERFGVLLQDSERLAIPIRSSSFNPYKY